jgi:gliding motility-associated-like protein
MRCSSVFCVALFILFSGIAPAKAHYFTKQYFQSKEWSFVENKGQLTDENGHVLSNIKYYGRQGDIQLRCRPDMLSFFFFKRETTEGISEASGMPVKSPHSIKSMEAPYAGFGSKNYNTTIARTDLILKGANPHVEITATGDQEYYENFYLAHMAEEGVTHVHTYKTIVYHNIYPHIDMVLHAKEKGIKYEFVVRPGGKASDIRLQWNGTSSLGLLKNGGMHYTNSLGEMNESRPVSFLADSTAVRSGFAAEGNTVSFSIGRYDHSQTLIIDPTLEWSTYFGGSAGDEGLGVSADTSGNVYLTGISASSIGIASFGSYQYHYSGAGNGDAFLAKFDSSGKRLWSTYYGKGSNEGAYAITLNNKDEPVILGSTQSIVGIATPGSFQYHSGGAEDAFLANFNSAGILLWSTYYGGNNEEWGTALTSDKTGNIYITGFTFSTSGIASANAFSTIFTGKQDAFLAKFSSAGSRMWSTYFGGEKYTQSYGVAVDNKGNVYITGETNCVSGIATIGSFKSTLSGKNDVFLAKFSDLGKEIWSTYYGGTTDDVANSITTDISGNVYLCGNTSSNNGISTPGSFQPDYISSDYFLTCFSSKGQLLWGTYVGGDMPDKGLSVIADLHRNIYLTGQTWSSNYIATSHAYQNTNEGGSGFVMKFSNAGSRIWGSYFKGGDPIFSCTLGKNNNLFICGSVSAGYLGSMSTAGAFQTDFGGGPYDAFLAKFNFPDAENDAGVNAILLRDTICSGTKAIMVEVKNFGNDPVDSLTVGWNVNSEPQKDIHISGRFRHDSVYRVNLGDYIFKAGTDTVKAWSINPNGKSDTIPYNDTAMLIVQVVEPIKPDAGGPHIICIGDSIRLGSKQHSGNYTYLWTSNPIGINDTTSSILVHPRNNVTYYLTVRPKGGDCSETDSAIITVHILPKASAGPDTVLCYDQTYVMQGAGGITYKWTPARYLSNDTIAHPVLQAPGTELYTLTVSNTFGCKDSARVYVRIKPRLLVKIKGMQSPVCYGTQIKLHADASGGDSLHYRFFWPEDKLSGQNISFKVHRSGWHKVILTDGCSAAAGTDSVFIQMLPKAKADFTILEKKPYKAENPITFQNESQNADGYSWSFGDNSGPASQKSPVHIYTDSGTYKVILIAHSNSGCGDDTAYGYIKILNAGVRIYIPNAFSPNGDGINDAFVISGDNIMEYSYTIYNRWGERLFESTGNQKTWNGYSNGAIAQEGVYMYMLKVVDTDNSAHYFSGNITLLR